MSKSTISALKTEIKTEMKCAYSTESDLKSLDKSIYNAMDDKVGCSARESLAEIRNRFSLNMDDGLKSLERAAGTLENSYGKTDNLSAQADSLLSRAKSIVKGLGEI